MNKLRQAAQAVVGCMDTHGFVLQHRIEALRDALAEDLLNEMQALTELDYREPEYELWGAVAGAPGGRWSVTQVNPEAVWPTGVALYVKRIKE